MSSSTEPFDACHATSVDRTERVDSVRVGSVFRSCTPLRILLLALAYFAAGKLGLLLARPGATPVWPPSGVALAALLLWGYQVWPGVFLGGLLVGLSTTDNSLTLVGVAAGNTLEALLGAWLTNRYANGSRFHELPLDVLKFFLLAGVVSPVLSPPVSVTDLSMRSLTVFAGDAYTWIVWWLGDSMSVLVLTPLIVLRAQRAREVWSGARQLERAAVFAMLMLVSGAVFGNLAPASARGFLLPYLCLPVIVWSAFRLGAGQTALATCALGAVALSGTLQGFGLFAQHPAEMGLIGLQGFMAFNSVMGLAVAAVVEKQRSAQASLKNAHQESERLVEQRTKALRLQIEERNRAERDLQKAHDELDRRVRERTSELTLANKSLEAEIRQRRQAEDAHLQVLRRLVDAQELERRRVSRELHDQLGQHLTALKIGIQVLHQRPDCPPALQPGLTESERMADSLMRDVHQLAWELRPAALDDFGLELALRRYTEEWSEHSGIRLDFHGHGLEGKRLPSRLESTLYRVTQEALTNVARHSMARRVSVLLERSSDRISLIVEDDGRGFDFPKMLHSQNVHRRLGLLGMEERVLLVGGVMEIDSRRGAGTAVFVRIPLQPIDS